MTPQDASWDLSAQSKQILAQIPTEDNCAVFEHFLMCTETPRMSGALDKIRDKLLQFAQRNGLDGKVDSIGNVRIRKSASEGHESAIKVAIQCHMDIVCTKTPESTHKFETDNIEVRLEGGYMKANGTTLGADDGIGIAACLALLSSSSAVHGPLECLFTVDEETTMIGAEKLDQQPFLEAEVMINVDSEEEHRICIGCAGGFEKQILLPVEEMSGEQLVYIELKLFGLLGGHTGIQIDLGRGNAIKLMAQILDAGYRKIPFNMVQFEGGNAVNAIPSSCQATVAVHKRYETALFENLAEAFEVIKSEYSGIECDEKGESCMKLEESILVECGDFKTYSARKILDVLLCCPHGVLRMSPEVKTDVQTSISCSMAKLGVQFQETNCFMVHLFSRSDSALQMEAVDNELSALARLCGAQTENMNPYPGWKPNLKSRVLNQAIKAHQELFKENPEVYSVHAGLECGLIQGRYPEMDCVSIGPQIDHAHSTDERLKIDSVKPFFNWVEKIVQNLAKTKKRKIDCE